MLKPDVPHFDFPLRLASTGAQLRVIDDQDDQDTYNSVEILLSTQLGERLDNPEYGIEDQTFREGGADLQHISEAINRWDGRVPVEVTSVEFIDMVQKIRVAIMGRSNG